MVNLTWLRLAIAISSSASYSSSAIGFSSSTCLPAFRQSRAIGKCVVLRRGRDVDHLDRVVPDDVLIVERRDRRIGERLDLGQPVGPDFADMQLLHQRIARQRFGADAAAPSGADDGDFNRFYRHFVP